MYPIGWSIGEAERAAITRVPTSAWSPAINADRDVRDGAQVAEPTGWLEPVGWPQGMRVMVRRERPHPGGQLTRCAQRDGWRHTALATDSQVGARRWLAARRRAHARVADRIRAGKTPGLGRLPSREFAIDAAWCSLAAIAVDRTAW